MGSSFGNDGHGHGHGHGPDARDPDSEVVRAFTAPAAGRAGRLVIVVGVDLSEVSSHLVATANGLIGRLDEAEIHVVHVVKPQTIPSDVMGTLPALDPSEASHVARAKEELEKLCGDPPSVESRVTIVKHVVVGFPVDELSRIAKEVGADVVVVEAHGRTGIARVFHRSVVAQLARKAPCSVLTVKAKVSGGSQGPPSSGDAATGRV